LQNKYISTKKIKNIISSIINIMHLEKIINQNFSKLSSGEKQLVILASILAMNYEVLIFDEANLFLDNKSKIDFSKLVNLLWKKYKKTII
jgi:energy-coupling factor transporter ATP-binding protein EcfA2